MNQNSNDIIVDQTSSLKLFLGIVGLALSIILPYYIAEKQISIIALYLIFTPIALYFISHNREYRFIYDSRKIIVLLNLFGLQIPLKNIDFSNIKKLGLIEKTNNKMNTVSYWLVIQLSKYRNLFIYGPDEYKYTKKVGRDISEITSLTLVKGKIKDYFQLLIFYYKALSIIFIFLVLWKILQS